MLIFMGKRTLVPLLAISIGMPLLVGCGSQNRQGHDGAVNVSIDLNKTAPIGYEICGDRPPRLSRASLDLRLQMPQRIEIPPEEQRLGAKYVEFRPGRHDIDLYRNLQSARVLYTNGDLAMEAGVPTIRAKLDTSKLSKGRYVLGIGGDPFFAYCTVDLP